MKVKDLVKILKEYDQNLPVHIAYDAVILDIEDIQYNEDCLDILTVQIGEN